MTAKVEQTESGTGLETDYALLDSGDGQKLERFGPKVLARPSSVCIWKKRKPAIWSKCDAMYEPEKGWKFNGPGFETWQVKISGATLELRLQTNGQTGLFPEHAGYLKELLAAAKAVKESSQAKPRMLNLFAYTGMASVFCAREGVEVTHVDLSKKALTWAQKNMELNSIPRENIRFIAEDALKYLEREIRRGSRYDILVVDPPSFSRISKNQFWKLEEVIGQLSADCTRVLDPAASAFLLTCHHPGLTCEMLSNVMTDTIKADCTVKRRELGIQEKESSRILSAGSFALAVSGIRPAGD